MLKVREFLVLTKYTEKNYIILEAYLEPIRTSTMELFYKNSFCKKAPS